MLEIAPEEDPRQELVNQLLEHERFKSAAEMLHQKRLVEEAVWSNPQIEQFRAEDDGTPGLAVTLNDLVKTFQGVMERAKIDVSLRKFLGDVGYAVMLLAVVIAALDTLGIKTTAVLAVLGAAGLAVGLALQGSLSNFAAGVMLIVLRPYKVSDIVVIGKYLGRIYAIKVFNTVMITSDYREITIPNGQIIAAFGF